MGILDDAIREHLELKRQRGADESELKQLEDEAFGPPTRPGEPDFPETGESPEQSGNGVAADAAVAEAPGVPEAPIAPPPAVPATGEEPEPDTGSERAIEEEEAREVAGEPQIGESSEEETAIYEPGEEAELEFGDLELELAEEQEGAPGEPRLDEAERASEGPHGEAEAPIETLETVEHPFPEELVEPTPPDEQTPPDEALPDREEPLPAEDEQPAVEEERSAEEGEDDVLADTPEFLKDAPEDDELWFEQREPKDFDF
jgi:hypothetical protein